MTDLAAKQVDRTIIGEPEVVEDNAARDRSTLTDAALTAAELVADPAWSRLKATAIALRPMQVHDGSIPDADHHAEAAEHVATIVEAVRHFAPLMPHDEQYLTACALDFERWADSGFVVPDFYDALDAFHPARDRRDGVAHLVVFPMYTQNGSADRLVEAVAFEVIWPDFVAELEAGDYGNALYLGLRFADFTPGYDTNSAVLFPESVAVTPRVP
ncbi:MAG: DUF6421 family protein, partial [Microcella sp.]|nr:DUF6421 family protein [Microcella sp.]